MLGGERKHVRPPAGDGHGGSGSGSPPERLLQSLHEVTGVPLMHLAVGLSIVVGASLIRIFGFGAFGRLFTFIYLVYSTFKVQDDNEESEMKDKLYWLTYWAFYGVWTIFDRFTDLVFNFSSESIIPYIDAFKLIFLAWCLLPQTRGAQQVYYLIIHRVLQMYETEIDNTMTTLKASMSQIMTEVGHLGLEFVMEFLQTMGVNIFQIISQLTGQLLVAASASPRTGPGATSPAVSRLTSGVLREIPEAEDDES